MAFYAQWNYLEEPIFSLAQITQLNSLFTNIATTFCMLSALLLVLIIVGGHLRTFYRCMIPLWEKCEQYQYHTLLNFGKHGIRTVLIKYSHCQEKQIVIIMIFIMMSPTWY